MLTAGTSATSLTLAEEFNMPRILTLVLLSILPLVSCAEELTATERERVCKGAVAVLFFPPIDSVRVTKSEGGIIYLSHVRQRDGSEWKTKCRIEGNSIIWGSADGRWRTHPQDEKLTFRIDRMKSTFSIRQVFEDGSSDEKTFLLEEGKG